jgi:hypothetical protein
MSSSQLTEVTGKRNHFSTPESRRRSRMRAAQIGRLERSAAGLATGVRSGAVRALETRVGAAVVVFGALTLGSVQDFKLPF